jgi:DNA repair photolyase
MAWKGRGSPINPSGRFEALRIAPDPEFDPAELPSPSTQFFHDSAGSAITSNDSPDVPFSFSLNIYRGCEHGCAYCFARPFHEYLGFSAGLDFETKIMVKTDAPALVRRELSARRWKPEVVVMSGVTDCYQPAERHFRLTRACLEIFAEFRNPVSIITKSALVTRDIDLLADLASHQAASVLLSITTLDRELARKMEPRASGPSARLRAIEQLSAAGIPVGVLAAPMIPGLTDAELPAILEAAKNAGATSAGYTVLRLPHGVKEVFAAWLDEHEPGRKARVLDRVRELRGGKLYDSTWGQRGTGTGIFAEQLGRLFEVTARRLGLVGRPALSTAAFRPPGGKQLDLFSPEAG